MKNILIITFCRDNQTGDVSFIKDIEDIKDENLKEMIIHCINKDKWEKIVDRISYWTVDGICGADVGYIFNDFSRFNCPITVEHIVNFVTY